MRSNILKQSFVIVTGLAAALAVTACKADSAMAPAPVDAAATLGSAARASGPFDIGGAWQFAEETSLTFPGELAASLGIAPEGPVLHVSCSSPQGVLTITQSGSTFTGTLTHPASSCVTRGGQTVQPPWTLPYEATLSGRLTGRALDIQQFDVVGPVECTKKGTLQVAGGTVTGMRTKGRCDLSSLPFRATATNSGMATR